MSLHMNAGMSRLTVLGTGWSNTAIDSGFGFTIDGEMWQNTATDLKYDFGNNVDWDLIANNGNNIDWTKVIYTDKNGTVYTDPDGDGVWTDPLTGMEYPGGGFTWVPDNMMFDFSDSLNTLAINDALIGQYSIPQDEIASLFGGKVSTEVTPTNTGSDRPHYYTPPVWYIQINYDYSIIFLDEAFFHGTADGGSITVYDEAITIRDGSSRAIYWSDCVTHFSDKYLTSKYSSYPIQYVCWQCVYGSLSNALISKNSGTITTDSIKGGTSGLQTMTYNGQTYYRV